MSITGENGTIDGHLAVQPRVMAVYLGSTWQVSDGENMVKQGFWGVYVHYSVVMFFNVGVQCFIGAVDVF